MYVDGKAQPLCNPTGHHEVKIEFPKGTNAPSAQFDVFPPNVKSCDERNPKVVPLNSGELIWYWDDRDNTGISEVVLQQIGQYSACITYRDRGKYSKPNLNQNFTKNDNLDKTPWTGVSALEARLIITTTDELDEAIDLGDKACFDKNEKATEPKDNPYCLEPLYIDPGWSSQTENFPGLDEEMTNALPPFITPDIVGNTEFTTSKDRDKSILESNQAPAFDTSQTFSLNNGGATTPSSLLNPLNVENSNIDTGANIFSTSQAVELADNNVLDLKRRRISTRHFKE